MGQFQCVVSVLDPVILWGFVIVSMKLSSGVQCFVKQYDPGSQCRGWQASDLQSNNYASISIFISHHWNTSNCFFKTNLIKTSCELMKYCSWCPFLSILGAFDVGPVGGVRCFFGGKGQACCWLRAEGCAVQGQPCLPAIFQLMIFRQW